MRELDHDDYLDADEVRLRVRAAWWAGFLWAAAGAVVVGLLAWGVR